MKFDASYTSVVGDLAMQYGKLESFYLDVITSAGSTYKSFDIDMVVPYMNGDNDQQIAKICHDAYCNKHRTMHILLSK